MFYLLAAEGDSPLGLMDKASDFYSEDCGFESRRGCFSRIALHFSVYPINSSELTGEKQVEMAA